MNNIYQVFGIGQCCIDYIARIDSYPPPDIKYEFQELVIQGGGPVATALVALARWGVTCAFTGVIGDDNFGNMIAKSLTDEGVNTNGLLIRRGFESQFAFILAEPGVGRRTIFWRRPTSPTPKPEELNYNMIQNSTVLHTDGLFPEASIAACKYAKEAGKKIVVDAGSLREGMLDLARLSDYFIASEKFAKQFVGDQDVHKACYQLSELGPNLVSVTLGAKGYIMIENSKIIKKPAYKVKAVDTTGCGDIFHAGFIYGLIKGWDNHKSLDFAAWAAAKSSLKLGGREGIPSIEDWKRESSTSKIL